MNSIIPYLSEKEHKKIVDIMLNNQQYADTPQIGIFWFDRASKDLLFVRTCDYNLQKDGIFNKTHKEVWNTEYGRCIKRGGIWKHYTDYREVPRGRVNYDVSNDSFYVCVGDWIDGHKKIVSELIVDYFCLEEFDFVKDEYWNIGQGTEH